MKCPNCQFDLPDGAKFCPKCGHRMTAAQMAAASAPAPPATDKTQPLATPIGAPAVLGPGGQPAAMTFYPADLDRALTLAIKKVKARPTKRKLADVAGYYAVGDELGIAKQEMEAALHAVALEKVKGVGPSPTAMFFRSPRVNTIYNALRIVEPKTRAERIKLYTLAGVAIVLVLATVVLGGVAWWQAGEKKLREAERERQRLAALELAMSRPAPVLGSIDKDAFNVAVSAVTPKLQACASSILKQQLTASATFKIAARVDLEGKLSEIKVRDPLNNEALRSCIEKEVAAQAFPKAEKAPVEIEFAATFEPPAK